MIKACMGLLLIDQAIKLDDPDFWKKIGLTDKSEPEGGEVVTLNTKRQRKAVALYDPHTGELRQRKKNEMSEDNCMYPVCSCLL
jgi:hypothetical protein